MRRSRVVSREIGVGRLRRRAPAPAASVVGLSLLGLFLLALAPAAHGSAGDHPAGVDPAASEDPSGQRLTVFVSILPQAFFVERIGGDHVSVHVLVGPGQSPATFDPTPRQTAALSEADVYFCIGVPMETQIVPHVARDLPGVMMVNTQGPPPPGDRGNRGPGGDQDLPTEHDPHVWLSPRLAQDQARRIAAALEALDPAHAGDYRANLSGLIEDLQRLRVELSEILAPVRGKKLIVFHPAYGHLAAEYGLEQVAIEKGGMAPSPRHLAEVLEAARAQGVKAIFVQPQFSAASARAVADALDAEIKVLDPLAPDYLDNLRRMAVEIRNGLDDE